MVVRLTCEFDSESTLRGFTLSMRRVEAPAR